MRRGAAHAAAQSWGALQELGLERFCAQTKALGYAGVEAPLTVALSEGATRFRNELQRHGLEYVCMVFSDGVMAPGHGQWRPHAWSAHFSAPSNGVKGHVRALDEQIDAGQQLLRPLLFNAHSGSDWMSVDEADEFFQGALLVERSRGVTLAHETHRSRVLHHPVATRRVLARFPELKINADISHWLCVCEVDAGDAQIAEHVRAIARNVHHIHARVGHAQGPQVVDPRRGDGPQALTQHLELWAAIFAAQRARGAAWSSVTTEHGPPPYQPVDADGKPLADIWAVNTFVGEAVRRRFDAP